MPDFRCPPCGIKNTSAPLPPRLEQERAKVVNKARAKELMGCAPWNCYGSNGNFLQKNPAVDVSRLAASKPAVTVTEMSYNPAVSITVLCRCGHPEMKGRVSCAMVPACSLSFCYDKRGAPTEGARLAVS
jgi:hypothetical protein